MKTEWKREVVSKPGAAVYCERVEVPDYIQRAISDSLERGRREAQRKREWWKFWR